MATATATRKQTGSRVSRKSARQDAKPMDAIKLLKSDHQDVKKSFEKYETLENDTEKQELANKICMALTVHAQIEEEIFYPAAREGTHDNDLLDEATVEHATAKQLISEIQSMKVGEDLFDAKVKVLGEYIDHHVQEEEKEMFPESRHSDMDLIKLGELLASRKAELMKKMGASA